MIKSAGSSFFKADKWQVVGKQVNVAERLRETVLFGLSIIWINFIAVNLITLARDRFTELQMINTPSYFSPWRKMTITTKYLPTRLIQGSLRWEANRFARPCYWNRYQTQLWPRTRACSLTLLHLICINYGDLLALRLLLLLAAAFFFPWCEYYWCRCCPSRFAIDVTSVTIWYNISQWCVH